MPVIPRGATTAAELSTDQLRLLDAMLLEEGLASDERRVPRRLSGREPQLSFAQQRMWFLHQLEPDGAAYNLPHALRMAGPLDVPALAASFDEIRRRHEVLRTTFVLIRGEPVARIGRADHCPIPVLDLTSLSAEVRMAEAGRLALLEARRPFDLSTGPLVRTMLFRLEPESHLLLLNLHHIVSDAWSQRLLLRELAFFYGAITAGAVPSLRELSIQYADFALWQRSRHGDLFAKQLEYWRRQLSGVPTLQLPTDRPRSAVPTSRGERIFFRFSPEAGQKLERICRRGGSTPFMSLLAVFAVLLGRTAGEDDVAVGTPTANRNLRELEDLIGCFANTLVLRIDLSRDPGWDEIADRVRQTAVQAYAHGDLPFDLLVEELKPERSLSHTPLFQVGFSFEHSRSGVIQLERLTLAPAEIDAGTAKFELSLIMGEQDQRLGGALEYRSDLFDRATMLRFLGHFQTLIDRIPADPGCPLSRLPLLTAAESAQLLVEWNRGEPAASHGRCLHQLFAAQAEAAPDRVALSHEGEQLTYGALDRRAHRLAQALRGLGIGCGDRVGLFFDNCPEAVLAILAVLQAGAAYVILDPSSPRERLSFILGDAGVSVVLAQRALVAALPASPVPKLFLDAAELFAGVAPEEEIRVPLEGPAYVVYTSGSTGRPKGVVVTHANVVRLFAQTEALFGFGERDAWTLFHSLAFDFSVWELWGALLYGGRLVIVPYLLGRSPAALRDLLAAERVTVLNQTPSAFDQLAAADAASPEPAAYALRWIVFGGEALDPRRLTSWFARHGAARPTLVNMYGITETTVHVTWRRLRAADGQGSAPSAIGGALPDLCIRLLDPQGQPVPIGVPGELYVAGPGVSMGYFRRPELTAGRFIPDAFSERPGERLYRSGDLARYLPHGDLEYLGRIDHQVKVRGFRIELGEIEAALMRHPSIRQAAVLLRDDARGPRLVAYLVPHAGRSVAAGELREFLRQWLPEHMLPAATVQLDELPLTRHGKLDRRALPAPGTARPELAEAYAAPRTLAEEVLAAAWAEVLSLDRVGIDDNFFSLGGDSIRSVQVLARAQERGLEISLPQLFQYQTIRGLAAQLRPAGPAGELAPTEPFSLLAPHDRDRLPAGVEDAYPLTAMQAGMLFHLELSPEAREYHNVNSYHLRGRLDTAALQAAVDRVVALHPVLRTGFDLSSFSEPLQLVYRTARLQVGSDDISHLSPGEQDLLLHEFVESQARELFDTTRPPQLRFHLHRRGADTFQLTLAENHVILDGWSLHATLREIFDDYFAALRGEAVAPDPPPASSFRDFVALERKTLQSAEARRYWAGVLDGCEPASLPRWPPAGGSAPDKGWLSLTLPADLGSALPALARSLGVPLKSVLLASHLAVLSAVTGRTDLLTGLVMHGRLESRDGERVRGLFVNTLPLRLEVPEGSWRQLIESAFAAEREMLPFRRYPVAALQKEWGASRPLFETLFNFVHFHVVEGLLRPGELEALGGTKREVSNFPFAVDFHVAPHTSAVALNLEYDAGRFPTAQMQGIQERFVRVLRAMVDGVDRVRSQTPLLSPAERHQILCEWSPGEPPGASGRDVWMAFEHQAAARPDAVAVALDAEHLTYGELRRHAGRLAHALAGLGVFPGSSVGICLERSPAQVAAVLAVLQAGAAYVPLEADQGDERLCFVLGDAEARVLITDRPSFRPDRLAELFAGFAEGAAPAVLVLDSAGDLAAAPGGSGPSADADPDHLAYVVYTSGSTGRPKGVMISRRSLALAHCAWEEGYALTASVGRLLQAASFAFDVFTQDLVRALLHGATLVMCRRDHVLDPMALYATLVEQQVDAVELVPAVAKSLCEHVEAAGGSLAFLRLLIVGADAWYLRDMDRLRRLLAPAARLLNSYGITETTIDTARFESTALALAPEGLVPIGRPFRNARVHVVDRHLSPVPPGTPGELCVGGSCLGRGYCGRPDLTAERFVAMPFGGLPGERLYRTGDLARYLTDGSLEFLGRIDHQVKIRGLRIEPGEVEAALARHAGVQQSVVVARRDRRGEPRLVAYVVPSAKPGPDALELRSFLARSVPEWMIPAAFVTLEQLPLNANSKVDRGALPEPPEARDRDEPPAQNARGVIEDLVAGIWGQVLARDHVGIHDDFFALGGHSLLATQVIARLRRAFDLDLPLRALFEAPTVAALAQRIARAQSGGELAAAPPPVEPVRRDRPLPISFAQQRLWFLDQLHPGSTSYLLPYAVRFAGPLSVPTLAASLAEVVRRHEVLRASFPAAEGRPEVVIAPGDVRPLGQVDLSALPAPRREAAAEAALAQEMRRPFDLAAGPLLRASVFRLSEREHVLLAVMHHIVSDGWSLEILARELAALYRAFAAGRRSPLPALPVQYVDFAAWQRRWLAAGALAAQLAFWRERLSGAPAELELPADRPRPPVLSDRGAVHVWRLPRPLASDLGRLSRDAGVTLFMTLLAGFVALLHRYSGQHDLSVGTPVAGRHQVETEDLIGFFVNTLVLRVELGGGGQDPSGETFQQLLARVKQAALEAHRHQDVPFEQVVEDLSPERSLATTPFFRVMFSLQNAAREQIAFAPDLRLSSPAVAMATAPFDLTLFVQEEPAGLRCFLRYRTDLFDAPTLERAAGHLGLLLAGAAGDPGSSLAELALLTPAERAQLIGLPRAAPGAGAAADVTLDELLREQAARRPDAVALACGAVQVSYGGLERAADRLARCLRRRGVAPEERVAVLLERGPDLVVSLFAIFKAGGVYVPLDPAYPRERLSFLAEDAGISVVLTQERLRARLAGLALASGEPAVVCIDGPPGELAGAAASGGEAPRAGLPDGLAYVIYTSGSTGLPKGVGVSHRAAARHCRSALDLYGVGAADRVLQFASASFDVSLEQILVALAGGACLVMRPEESWQPAELLRRLGELGLTVANLPTAFWQQLTDEAGDAGGAEPHGLQLVIAGGEAMPAAAVQRWRSSPLASVRLLNAYGPTEAAITSTAAEVGALAGDAADPTPIGRGIAGIGERSLFVVDAGGGLVPLGVSGELSIGGPLLSRGYLGRPALTAERFVPDPFAAALGSRLYRTGDRVRLRADGQLEFLGRLDNQVKVRGFRIEPGEVEAALVRHPGVRQAVVVAREDGSGGRGLVAYVVAAEGAEPAAEELRAFAADQVPAYMVPGRIVKLGRLPLTPVGKVDQRALPSPEPERAQMALALPRNAIEDLLVQIWCEVLGLERVGIYDNFFNLGGHSMLATQVISRQRRVLGVELPLRDIFEAPTIAGLAERVRATLDRRDGLPAVPPIALVPRQSDLPLSFAQQRLWFLDQLEPGRPLYNLPVGVRLHGPLDLPALAAAFDEIRRRHEVLRTTFASTEAEPVQVIAPLRPEAVPMVDLSALPVEWRVSTAHLLASEDAKRPFDLARGPMLRLQLLKVAEQDHVLTITIHHIASDGWSMRLLTREMVLLYQAFAARRPSPLPELPVQYADFAAWQRRWLEGSVVEAQIAYWREKLRGAPAILELPTDRPRPAVPSYGGATCGLLPPPGLYDGLKTLSRKQGATMFMTLLAAFDILLYRYTGQTDLVVGTPIAGRSRVEIEELIGVFVNTLVLRVDLAGDPTFAELLARVREVLLEAYRNQDAPFERLVEELDPERSLSQTPLFQVMFAFQVIPEQGSGPVLEALEISNFEEHSGTAKFDFMFGMSDRGNRLVGAAEYATDLFEPVTMSRLVAHLRGLLAAAVACPGERIGALPMLGSGEHWQIVCEWNDTAEERLLLTAPRLFERQARQAPEAAAVAGLGADLTYRELDRRANALAHFLRSRGVGPDVTVALRLQRSAELVLAVLATLKAGGAYLPLDPAFPEARTSFMLEDARAAILLTQQRLLGSGPELPGSTLCLDADEAAELLRCGAAEPPRGSQDADHLAYLIYTSGSTGQPKGVAMRHGALANLIGWQVEHSRLGAGARTLQFTSLSFDVSFQELFATWGSGGTLVLIDEEDRRDSHRLCQILEERAIERLFMPYIALQQLAEAVQERDPAGLCLREIVTAGEQLQITPAMAGLLRRVPAAELENQYGPAEAPQVTFWSAAAGIAAGGPVLPPIGRAVPQVEIRLLDAAFHAVPIGVPAELCIGGEALARCYHERPEITAERFVPDPFAPRAGARVYRTSDLARWRANGEIDFLGRADAQVKVRGFRIEPAEVEAALGLHPGMREAVVLAPEAPSGRRLVAYVVLEPDRPFSAGELRQFLIGRLPDYMVPAVFVPLVALPLTPSGKVDRQALLAMQTQRAAESEGTAPRNYSEEILAEIWADVLGHEQVGVHDNFFELGGHSLLATQIISRVRRSFQVELPLRDLFEVPTVAGLAERINMLLRSDAAVQPPIVPVPREGGLPLSFAQERMWFIYQMDPASSSYNIPMALPFEGRIHVPVLEKVMTEIVRRHECLRTAFELREGTPVQKILPPAAVTIPMIDLAGLGDALEPELARLQDDEESRAFDLAAAPALRLGVAAFPGQQMFFVTLHHIATDGWSLDVLRREIGTLYDTFSEGRPSPLQELPVQYVDYACWQRASLPGDMLHAQLGAWLERLRQAPQVLDLPTDRARPAVLSSRGGVFRLRIPPAKSDRLRTFARERGQSLFMVMLGVFTTLLARYSGQRDLCIGTPVAGRGRLELENLIGLFVNTLVLRLEIAGEPAFSQLLETVREMALWSFARQDLPFERLVEELKPERSLSHSPLFQTVFAFQAPRAVAVTDDRPARQARHQTANFELSLSMSDEGVPGIVGFFVYKTDLFDASTIQRLGGHFDGLAREVLESPERPIADFALLSPPELQQVLREAGRDEDPDSPSECCLHELYRLRAAAAPDAVALSWSREHLTYGGLERRADRLAHRLKDLGVSPGDRVALLLERGPQAIAGILAILKAGAAYVPLDPAYPRERVRLVLTDAATPVLLTQARLWSEDAPPGTRIVRVDGAGGEDETPVSGGLDVRVPPQSPAYVIYTSGSTGRPKGVVVTHANAVQLFMALRGRFGFDARDVWTLFHSLAFDFSVWELWGALLFGGRLVVVPHVLSRSPAELRDLLLAERVTVLNQTPSAFGQLLAAEALSPGGSDFSLRWVIFGGEALDPRTLRPWIERYGDESPRLVNMYGITETTVHVTWRRVRGADTAGGSRIGGAIPGLRLRLLDAGLQPVPLGAPGELCVGGAGVTQGYLGRPDLTAERFVPDPFAGTAGERLYRSGDLARCAWEGDVEYLGRIDHQVKIRGYRIELGEIEATLLQHPGVRQAVAIAVGPPEDRRLAAYLVLVEGAGVEAAELRAILQEKLPPYMVPASFAVLARLPQTPSGKIDRRALTASEPLQEARHVLPPRDRMELALAGIWEELLGTSPVSVTDSFFDLGGHSLLAMRLSAQVEARIGRRLALADLFLHPTLEALAARLRRVETPLAPPSPLALRATGTRPNLFLVHPGGGSVLAYVRLVHSLGPDQPVYAFQAPGLEGEDAPQDRVENLAARYEGELRSVQRRGPYLLGGWSFGGVVAFDLAQRLAAQGEEVALLALIDSWLPARSGAEPAGLQADLGDLGLLAGFAQDLGLAAEDLAADAATLAHLDSERILAVILERAKARRLMPHDMPLAELLRRFAVFAAHARALRSYRPAPFPGRILFLRASEPLAGISPPPVECWQDLALAGLEVAAVSGSHFSLVQEPHVHVLARLLGRAIDAAAGAAQ